MLYTWKTEVEVNLYRCCDSMFTITKHQTRKQSTGGRHVQILLSSLSHCSMHAARWKQNVQRQTCQTKLDRPKR